METRGRQSAKRQPDGLPQATDLGQLEDLLGVRYEDLVSGRVKLEFGNPKHIAIIDAHEKGQAALGKRVAAAGRRPARKNVYRGPERNEPLFGEAK